MPHWLELSKVSRHTIWDSGHALDERRPLPSSPNIRWNSDSPLDLNIHDVAERSGDNFFFSLLTSLMTRLNKMCPCFPGGSEKLPHFQSPVFTLGLSPCPDSLLAHYLGYTSNITTTSRQLFDLNTKLRLQRVWERNWTAGVKRKKLDLTTTNFCIFLYSLKHLSFACNENHTDPFPESILRNRRKRDSKLSQLISSCSWHRAY